MLEEIRRQREETTDCRCLFLCSSRKSDQIKAKQFIRVRKIISQEQNCSFGVRPNNVSNIFDDLPKP